MFGLFCCTARRASRLTVLWRPAMRWGIAFSISRCKFTFNGFSIIWYDMIIIECIWVLMYVNRHGADHVVSLENDCKCGPNCKCGTCSCHSTWLYIVSWLVLVSPWVSHKPSISYYMYVLSDPMDGCAVPTWTPK